VGLFYNGPEHHTGRFLGGWMEITRKDDHRKNRGVVQSKSARSEPLSTSPKQLNEKSYEKQTN